MRRACLMVSLWCAILTPVRADDWTELMDAYLKVQAALADDSFQGVPSAAGLIEWKSALLGPAADSLRVAAKGVSTAPDLAAAREAFGKLTEALLSYTESSKTVVRSDVRLARCPTLKKNWLQQGDKIRNPYYGAKKRDCGQFVSARK